eukprot:5797868-Pleurochrysis_carterae.AAC.1
MQLKAPTPQPGKRRASALRVSRATWRGPPTNARLALPGLAQRQPRQLIAANAAAGDDLLVPADIYPREECRELDGVGWRVRVLRKRKRLLLVDFVDA